MNAFVKFMITIFRRITTETTLDMLNIVRF